MPCHSHIITPGLAGQLLASQVGVLDVLCKAAKTGRQGSVKSMVTKQGDFLPCKELTTLVNTLAPSP